MTKTEARKKYRKLRNRLSDEIIVSASAHICEQLKNLDFSFQTVHVFLPIKRLKEIDLWEFIEHCYSRDKTVCTSVSDFETSQMKTIQITPETIFKESAWGIPEPTSGVEIQERQIDLVIVPLLYADSAGNRIGYGKGFYDRFLSKCNPEIRKIGVNYFEADQDIQDTEKTDVRIDQLVINQ